MLGGQRTTSFSHERGDAFQIFCCVGSAAYLFVNGIHAEIVPIVAMKPFRGGALPANLASTITRALGVVAVRVVVLRVTRLGALFLGGLPDVALALSRRRRRRRGGRRRTSAFLFPEITTNIVVLIFREHARRLHTLLIRKKTDRRLKPPARRTY